MATKVSSAAEMVKILDEDVAYVQENFGVMTKDVNFRDIANWNETTKLVANIGVSDESKIVPALRIFQSSLAKLVSLHVPFEGTDQGPRWNMLLRQMRSTLGTLKTLMNLGEYSGAESTSPGWTILPMDYERDVMPKGKPGRLIHLRNNMKMFSIHQSVDELQSAMSNPNTLATVIESCEANERRIAAYIMATRVVTQAQFHEGVDGKMHHLNVFDVAFRDSMIPRGVREFVGADLIDRVCKGANIEVYIGSKSKVDVCSPFSHLEDSIARRIQRA
jgi:hypothetical protein